jgi:hypothetical protein
MELFLYVYLCSSSHRSVFSAGKVKYTHKSMEAAHMRLFQMGLGGKEFDLVANHLVKTLQSLKVPEDIVTDVVGVVGPLRSIFVEGYEKYNGDGGARGGGVVSVAYGYAAVAVLTVVVAVTVAMMLKH